MEDVEVTKNSDNQVYYDPESCVFGDKAICDSI